MQEFDSNLERLVPLTLVEESGPVRTTLLPQQHHLALVSSQNSVPILQREPDNDHYTHSGEASNHWASPCINDDILKKKSSDLAV